MLPVLLHLIFHPESERARQLALALHTAVNDDPTMPGLRIPTVIAREDGSGLPPDGLDLDGAARNFVLVLADDNMVVPVDGLPPGRQDWPAFVAGLWQASQDQPALRFLPVQLTESAWPLDPALDGTNFVRAVAATEPDRTLALIRRVMVELCRFLSGDSAGASLALRVFLSHAKADIAADPKVYQEIQAHLDVTQPIKTWIDSADINGGSQFAQAIEQGIQDSLLLVLATRSHSSRTWCRKEILLAKRHARPFVVIEALDGVEMRGFPYLGNAPKLRWTPGAAREAVDLLLKETLRHLHAATRLQGLKRDGDLVLAAPPELATLVRLPRGSTVLYPDPPLGDEEIEELAPLGIQVETPLQRAAADLKLGGIQIVLSCSQTEDGPRYGALPGHLDALLIEISRQLLVRGASLEYGGNPGADSYALALFEMVRAYGNLSGLPPVTRIINDVGWPLPLRTLPVADRAKFANVAILRRIPRPEGIADLEPETFVEEPRAFPSDDSVVHRFAWALGMSAMRAFQAGLPGAPVLPDGKGGRARIVLGGKIGPHPGTPGTWYSGRIPGVVEEVLCSLRAGQPLYLLGACGGAAALVIDLLEGRPRSDFTWDFHRRAPYAEALRDLYVQRGLDWEDYPAMTQYFGQTGVGGVAARNGLSVEENRELFACRDAERATALILKGLQAAGV